MFAIRIKIDSFLFLVVRPLLLVAMHLFLVANIVSICIYTPYNYLPFFLPLDLFYPFFFGHLVAFQFAPRSSLFISDATRRRFPWIHIRTPGEPTSLQV